MTEALRLVTFVQLLQRTLTIKVTYGFYSISLVLLGWFLRTVNFDSKVMPTNDTDYTCHIHKSCRTCLTNHMGSTSLQ